jgi:hypothetical protein
MFSFGSGTGGCFQTSGERTITGSSPYINNSLLFPHFFPVLYLVEKKYFHGNVRTYKIGGAPSATALGSSARGDPSKYT